MLECTQAVGPVCGGQDWRRRCRSDEPGTATGGFGSSGPALHFVSAMAGGQAKSVRGEVGDEPGGAIRAVSGGSGGVAGAPGAYQGRSAGARAWRDGERPAGGAGG